MTPPPPPPTIISCSLSQLTNDGEVRAELIMRIGSIKENGCNSKKLPDFFKLLNKYISWHFIEMPMEE